MIVNDQVVRRIVDQLSSGTVRVDRTEPVTSYRIAVWDDALNCTRSPEQTC